MMESARAWRAVLPDSRLGYVYAALVLLRLGVAVWSPAYIHPDEYFQSAEPVLSDWLDIETVRTWEFDPAYPCRSMASLRLFDLPLLILVWAYKHCGSAPPAALLFLTQRLTAFCYSLIIDACVPSLMTFRSREAKLLTRIVLASNGAILAFSSRPFSNAVEAALLALCLRCGQAIQKRATDWSQAGRGDAKTVLEGWSGLSSLLGLFLSLGVFSRFTFALFALPLGVQYLLTAWDMSMAPAQRSGQVVAPIFRPVRALLLCSDAINGFLTGALAHIFHDTVYYRSLLASEEQIDTSSAMNFVASLVKRCRFPPVVAPFNALAYNLQADNLAQHGLHPRWLHALVNAPMMLGVAGWLGCCALAYLWVDAGGADFGPRRRRTASGTRVCAEQTLLLATIFVPLALLSVQPHQEPRFLLPLMVPTAPLLASLLCDEDPGTGPEVGTSDAVGVALTSSPPGEHQPAASKAGAAPTGKKRSLRGLFWTLQIIQAITMTLFFGFLHQAGVVPALLQLNREISSLSHSAASQTSLPSWLGAGSCGDRSSTSPQNHEAEHIVSTAALDLDGSDSIAITLHAWHTFMPPRHLFIPESPYMASSASRKVGVTLIDHGSLPVDSLRKELAFTLEQPGLADIHVLLAPTWAVAALQEGLAASADPPRMCLDVERTHSPHLDMDHLPETWEWITSGRELVDGDRGKGWPRRIRDGFGLSVVRLRIP